MPLPYQIPGWIGLRVFLLVLDIRREAGAALGLLFALAASTWLLVLWRRMRIQRLRRSDRLSDMVSALPGAPRIPVVSGWPGAVASVKGHRTAARRDNATAPRRRRSGGPARAHSVVAAVAADDTNAETYIKSVSSDVARVVAKRAERPVIYFVRRAPGTAADSTESSAEPGTAELGMTEPGMTEPSAGLFLTEPFRGLTTDDGIRLRLRPGP